MSLLMEALRKADQVKKRGTNGSPPAAARPEKVSGPPVVPVPPTGGPAAVEPFFQPLSGSAPLTIETEEETAAAEDARVVLEARQVAADNRDLTPASPPEALSPSAAREAAQAEATLPAVSVTVLPPQAVAPMAEMVREIAPAAEKSPEKSAGWSGAEKSPEQSRQAARAVFLAKNRQQRRGFRRRALGYSMLALLGVAGAAGYLYLSSANLPASLIPNRLVTVPPPYESAEIPAAETSGTPAPAVEALPANPDRETPEHLRREADIHLALPTNVPVREPAREKPIAPSSAAVDTITEPLPPAAPDADSRYEPAPLTVSETEASLPPSIRITKRTAAPQHDALLTAANAAFEEGRYEESRSRYRRILQAEPDHRGALLGLAALAVRAQDAPLARDLYLRMLTRNPADPLAKAGLLSIMTKDDPARLESELKLLLEVHPDLAPLFFLLGNVYAGNRRWNEAQQAYFQAVQAAGKSGAPAPDYPFNLAVSLEHLGRPALAARYYRESLVLAGNRQAGFDREAVRRQLEMLEAGAK